MKPGLSREICRFLTLWAAKEIDRQDIVHVSDRRCLRPAVRPIRCDGHEPMSVQKLKDLGFQGVVHKPSPDCQSRTPALPMGGLTDLMQSKPVGGRLG